MTAGRPPKPTALKVLQGNPGKRALNSSEPIPPAGPVKAPTWLRGRGRTIFKRSAVLLEQMRVVTPADSDALALLCDAYAEYIECRELVKKLGMTYEGYGEEGAVMIRPRPEVKMASDAWRRVQRMMTDFGFTPSARSKLHVQASDPPEDPFAAWERDGRSTG